MFRFRSLAYKLTAAFVLVVAVAVGAVALLVNASASRNFTDYVSEGVRGRMEELVPALQDYYATQGRWEGIDSYLEHGRMMGGMAGAGGRRMQGNPWVGIGGVVLADAQGSVLSDTTSGRRGGPLSAQELAQAEPIHVDGRVVGYVLAGSGPQEAAFETRLGQSILYAGLLAGLVAIGLGLLLTRSVLRPLRAVEEGARRIAQGDLSQRVDVDTPDEIGSLARQFNAMAATLERQEDLRKAMMADVAHELRTPLAVIRAQVEALQDGVFPLTPENVAPIHDQVMLLGRLVNDLRELALAEAGQLPLERAEIDPALAARRVAASLAARAADAGVDLRVDAPSGAAPLWADGQRVEQILSNLLANAIRYTPAGGTVTLRLADSGDQVAYSVEDTGTGITPEDLPHVFDRFYRADASRSRSEGTTGLGLSIARQLAASHGGDITVTSEVGVGTAFTVTLPRTHAAAGATVPASLPGA